MTMPIRFDTLEYAKRLAEAGIPQDHADAHAEALSAALATATVTPGELVLVRAELLARMDLLRTELLAAIDQLRTELVAEINQLRTEVFEAINQLKADIDTKLRPLRWLIGIVLGVQVVTLSLVGALFIRMAP